MKEANIFIIFRVKGFIFFLLYNPPYAVYNDNVTDLPLKQTEINQSRLLISSRTILYLSAVQAVAP